MSLLVNFRRRSILYQTVVAGAIFLAVYTLYTDYMGMADIGESLFATVIFAGSYFVTSTVILRRKMRSRK
jgi:hypothetical protein